MRMGSYLISLVYCATQGFLKSFERRDGCRISVEFLLRGLLYDAKNYTINYFSSFYSYPVPGKFAEDDDPDGKYVLCSRRALQPGLHHHLRSRSYGCIRL